MSLSKTGENNIFGKKIDGIIKGVCQTPLNPIESETASHLLKFCILARVISFALLPVFVWFHLPLNTFVFSLLYLTYSRILPFLSLYFAKYLSAVFSFGIFSIRLQWHFWIMEGEGTKWRVGVTKSCELILALSIAILSLFDSWIILSSSTWRSFRNSLRNTV